MSCEECSKEQEDPNPKLYYFRWKNANILLLGCVKHITEVMDALRNSKEKVVTP